MVTEETETRKQKRKEESNTNRIIADNFMIQFIPLETAI